MWNNVKVDEDGFSPENPWYPMGYDIWWEDEAVNFNEDLWQPTTKN